MWEEIEGTTTSQSNKQQRDGYSSKSNFGTGDMTLFNPKISQQTEKVSKTPFGHLKIALKIQPIQD